LHNTTKTAGHWIKVRLVGTKSNRDGIGAMVEVSAGGLKQRAERVAASGYLSQDDWRLHFGLGTNARADRITVTWPSGIRQVMENVAADQVVTIQEKP
jgi:enediyne biosynthesis protein E4